MSDTGRALVIGGSGDIGRRLVGRLDDPVAVAYSGGEELEVPVLRADATEAVPVELERFDRVYHLATLNSGGHPALPEDSPDIAGTETLIDDIEELPAEEQPELVYGSSVAAVDPDPVDEPDLISYGEAKQRGEELVREIDTGRIVRLGTVYGDGKGAIAYFQQCAREGEPLGIYGDGSQERPFVHVEDAVDALLDDGGSVEVAGDQYSLDAVADRIEAVTGVEREYDTDVETSSMRMPGDFPAYDTERSLDDYIERSLG